MPLTSRNLAATTGIPLRVVSALLRRYADRRELVVVGLGPKLAKGGLRATVYALPTPADPVAAPGAPAPTR